MKIIVLAEGGKVPSDSDCPAKQGKDEDRRTKSSASGEATLPAKQGKGEDRSSTSNETTCSAKESKDECKIASSTPSQESSGTMDVEEVGSEEDMDAEDGASSISQVSGTESPDKKCKLDTARISNMDMH